jgi:hypothetical protein
MSFEEFLSLYNNLDPASPPLVILLEGRRQLPANWAPRLSQFAEQLARAIPHALFRTGNAEGADSAFATGVARVDPSRIEYILPYHSHKLPNRIPGARSLSFDKITSPRAQEIAQLSGEANPSRRRLFTRYSKIATTTHRPAPDASAQAPAHQAPHAANWAASYLLRDTLKVTGHPSQGWAPATVGLFYVDPAAPYAGGTGHTIRVCHHLGVPVHSQKIWARWLDDDTQHP